jgi:hypothetical protein
MICVNKCLRFPTATEIVCFDSVQTYQTFQTAFKIVVLNHLGNYGWQ